MASVNIRLAGLAQHRRRLILGVRPSPEASLRIANRPLIRPSHPRIQFKNECRTVRPSALWCIGFGAKLAKLGKCCSRRTFEVRRFLSDSKCSKCLPAAFTYSLNLFLKPHERAFLCRKFSHALPSTIFNSETDFGFG